MPNQKITITFGNRNDPPATRWAMARGTIAAGFAFVSLISLANPPAQPDHFGRWLLSLGVGLTAALGLLAFDAWRTRRRRAGHRWF